MQQKLLELCPDIGREKRPLPQLPNDRHVSEEDGDDKGDVEVDAHLTVLAETVDQLENLGTSITTLFTSAQRARGYALGHRLTSLFSSSDKP